MGPRRDATQDTYLGVHLERQHDLGRAVPPRRDVLGHEARLLAIGVRGARAAREPGVCNLEVAVRVQEQVRRLQIAVDDVRAVHRLERAQRLINEVLHVRDPVPKRDRSAAWCVSRDVRRKAARAWAVAKRDNGTSARADQ